MFIRPAREYAGANRLDCQKEFNVSAISSLRAIIRSASSGNKIALLDQYSCGAADVLNVIVSVPVAFFEATGADRRFCAVAALVLAKGMNEPSKPDSSPSANPRGRRFQPV